MKPMNERKKKKIVRVVMFIMALIMIASFVMLPALNTASAEEYSSAEVTEFSTGHLAEALEEACGGIDRNNISKIMVSGGTMNADDYSAIRNTYQQVEWLELANCTTEDGAVPASCFTAFNKLEYLSLPSNTVTIGDSALADNRYLTKLCLPNTVKNVGAYAFKGCEKIESFSIPQLETIGTGAFEDCKALTHFDFPSALTAIPDSCFKQTALTEFTLGPNVTSIGNNAFENCHQLTDVYFYGDTAPSIGGSAFQNVHVNFHAYADTDLGSINDQWISAANDISDDTPYVEISSDEADDVQTEAAPVESVQDEADMDESIEETALDEASDSEGMTSDTIISEEAAFQSAQTERSEEKGSSDFSPLSITIITVLCIAVITLAVFIISDRKKKN